MTTPRLLDLFTRQVQDGPDEAVLYDGLAGAGAARVVTRRALRELAADMAADLRGAGIGEGDCIAVWLPNWSSAVAAQLAALSVGAHVVGVNTRYNSDEVAHVLAMASPRAILIAHDFNNLDLRGRLHAAMAEPGIPAPYVLVVAAPGTDQPDDVASYDVGAGADVFPRSTGHSDLEPHPVAGLCTTFTTSGSTGRSKLAAHAEAGVTAHSLAVAERAQIGAGDVVLGALPLSGVFGFTPSMAALVSGAAILLEPVFDAAGVLADMSTYGVTHAAGADDLFGRLRAAWPAEGMTHRMRWIGIADFEGRSAEFAEWAEAELGCSVVGVYGSSEIFALTSFWDARDPAELRWSGGGHLVSPQIRARIADPATGSEVERGGEGEIQFQGPNVVDAYLGDQKLSEGTFTDDGWFRSGDLGRAVDDDTIEFVCRMGDALRLRGFLVDPSEIELRLNAHPGVEVGKVVGVPGPGGGTVAVAFVVPQAGAAPEPAELRAWCAETLAKFKVPSEVYLLEEMPTTSGTNGTKIRSAALREIARERLLHRGA
ncbi:AMP-binding protein [Nocardioides pakistanensis]